MYSIFFLWTILCVQLLQTGALLRPVPVWRQGRCRPRKYKQTLSWFLHRHAMPLCQAATVPFDLVFRRPLSVNGIPDCQGINKSFTALGQGSFQCLMTLFLYLWAAPFSLWINEIFRRRLGTTTIDLVLNRLTQNVNLWVFIFLKYWSHENWAQRKTVGKSLINSSGFHEV